MARKGSIEVDSRGSGSRTVAGRGSGEAVDP